MQILFWMCILILIYPYLAYPLLLWIITMLRSKPIQKGTIRPRVSVIIAAHNEEKVIEDRLRNLKEIDYPRDKLEIIIVSDGSTDRTNQEITAFKENHPEIEVILDYEPVRVGKTGAIYRGVQRASGEILIFSDANTQFDRFAIQKLVNCFNDEKVGGASGQVRIAKKPGLATSQGEGLYWRIEDFIKRKESQIHSVMGADGSIYAIRKQLFTPLETGVAYSDDFIISMQVIPQGYRLVYEPEAIAMEESSRDFRSEFQRKIRSTSGGLHGYQKLWQQGMLNPFKSPIWWQLISHRVIRFAVPWAMIMAFVSNICLVTPLYRVLFMLQMVFYLLVLGGLFLPWSIGKKKLFYIPTYFSLMHMMFILSLFRFLRGRTEIMWEKKGR